jgi:hypothetical protein
MIPSHYLIESFGFFSGEPFLINVFLWTFFIGF